MPFQILLIIDASPNAGEGTALLGQFDAAGERLSVEYGMGYWLTDEDYADINEALCQAYGNLKGTVMPALLSDKKTADLRSAVQYLAAAETLASNYGLELDDLRRMT